MSPGKSRTEFLKVLAVDTANTDYQRAWDLSEATEDPYLKKQLQSAAILELAETNPEGALTFASEQDDCAEAMSDVLRHWVSKDADAALSYIRAMPQSDQSVEALGAYIEQTASSSSLLEVQQLLQTLPVGKVQDHAIESVAMKWSQSNPMVLAEWINEMPPSAGRDGAVCALADSLESYDYSQAFAWSTTIADEQRREWRLRSSLGAYAELEPEAAKQLLDESDLSRSEKAELYREVFDK
ncbi:MAG: hypothetical protein ACSHYA_19825 [Opitutaceae bacterium]